MNNQTKTGECEICDKTDVHLTCHYGDMWFCDDCWEKEQRAVAENMTPEAQQRRVDESNAKVLENKALELSRQIDVSIETRSDLFNANTKPILELKAIIDADSTITNKPFALFTELKNRFDHDKQIIFELQEKIVEANNRQKAIQVYMNQFANTLRTEEREKLKIADMSYQPITPTIRKPRAISTTQTSKKTKIDKTELRKFAAELQISEFMLQQIVVQKGVTVAKAAEIIKASIEAAKTVK